jgi:hypothetical protein
MLIKWTRIWGAATDEGPTHEVEEEEEEEEEDKEHVT